MTNPYCTACGLRTAASAHPCAFVPKSETQPIPACSSPNLYTVTPPVAGRPVECRVCANEPLSFVIRAPHKVDGRSTIRPASPRLVGVLRPKPEQRNDKARAWLREPRYALRSAIIPYYSNRQVCPIESTCSQYGFDNDYLTIGRKCVRLVSDCPSYTRVLSLARLFFFSLEASLALGNVKLLSVLSLIFRVGQAREVRWRQGCARLPRRGLWPSGWPASSHGGRTPAGSR
jgi:hypothetical protein